MDEEKLQAVVQECVRMVMLFARAEGLTDNDFSHRQRLFRKLDADERFRVLVLLAKERAISSTVGVRGAWRFYPRHAAPATAFNFHDVRGKPNAVVASVADIVFGK